LDGIVEHIQKVWQRDRTPLLIFISPDRMATLKTQLVACGFPPVTPVKIGGVDVLVDRQAKGIIIFSMRRVVYAS
jgi:hypothetical protein